MKYSLLLAVAGVSASGLQKTAPIDIVRAEAKREGKENVQIHDYWASLEESDSKKEKQIRHNRNLMMLQMNTKTTPLDKISREVKSDFQNRVHISDAFAADEKADVKKEKAIRANKNLRAFIQMKTKTSPIDQVAAAVKRDTRDNIRISDGFKEQEKKSIENEKKVRKSFLQSKTTPDFSMDDDDDKKGLSEMDKYVNEYEKKQKKLAIDSTDFSQTVPHTYTEGGKIISIPLSSQLQKSMSF